MSKYDNNRKLIPLSAASLGKLASKYATSAQTAEKASSSKQIRNPDLNALPDQNMMTQINKVLSEDYNSIINLKMKMLSSKNNIFSYILFYDSKL